MNTYNSSSNTLVITLMVIMLALIFIEGIIFSYESFIIIIIIITLLCLNGLCIGHNTDLLGFERLCNLLDTLLLHLVFVMHAQLTHAQTEH